MEYKTIKEEKKDISKMLEKLSARSIHKIRVYAATLEEMEMAEG